MMVDPALPTDQASALGVLYRQWRPDFPEGDGQIACAKERLRELGCLVRIGTWKTVRRFNLPAVLALVLPGGVKHYVTVTALEEESAQLALGGRAVSVPTSEIDHHWDGWFTVLWKLPPSGTRTLGPGAVGRDVEWLREQMEAIDGVPKLATARNVYDEELVARVKAFQGSRRLAPDGIVGVETLVQLSLVGEPGIPRLTPTR